MRYPAARRRATTPSSRSQSPTSDPELAAAIARAEAVFRGKPPDSAQPAAARANRHAPAQPRKLTVARRTGPYWISPRAVYAFRGLAHTAAKLYVVALNLERLGDRECWASISTLARLTATGRTTVKRNLHRLQRAGAIKLIHRRHPITREFLTNVIRILPGWPPSKPNGMSRR